MKHKTQSETQLAMAAMATMTTRVERVALGRLSSPLATKSMTMSDGEVNALLNEVLLQCPKSPQVTHVYHGSCVHCLETYQITDENSTMCGSCVMSKKLINMWAMPRGKTVQFPECMRSNKDSGYEFVLRIWRRFKRCPKVLLPNVDFSGSMYEGYMGSLMTSLFLQKEFGLKLFEDFEDYFARSDNIQYEHVFSLEYWSGNLDKSGLLGVFGHLKSGLKGELKDFVEAALPCPRRVYVGTLWSSVFLSKKFENYEETLCVFLRLLNIILETGMGSPNATDPMRLSCGTAQNATEPMRLSYGTAQNAQLEYEAAPDTDTMLKEVGSLFDELTEDDRHTTVKRLKFDNGIYMFHDLVELLISKRTHVFKKESNQNFLSFCLESGMLSDTVMNYGLFTKFILMVVPEYIKDLASACDHIGKEMIRLLSE